MGWTEELARRRQVEDIDCEVRSCCHQIIYAYLVYVGLREVHLVRGTGVMIHIAGYYSSLSCQSDTS